MSIFIPKNRKIPPAALPAHINIRVAARALRLFSKFNMFQAKTI